MYIKQEELEKIVEENSNLKDKFKVIHTIYIISLLIIGIFLYCTINRVKEAELQRDLLSDTIRAYEDQDDKEDISILTTADYFLELKGYSKNDLKNWVYCY